MKKIKVVYLINDLLMGGAQRILVNLVTKMDKERFDIEIAYLKEYDNLKRSTFNKLFTDLGVNLHFIGEGNSIIKLINNLYKKLKLLRPDVMHCMLPDSVILGVFVGKLLGYKNIILHEMNNHNFFSRKLNFAYEFARKFASISIFYSELLEKQIIGTSNLITKPIDIVTFKSCTIYNGIDLDEVQATLSRVNVHEKRKELNLRVDDVVILCASRLIGWKGFMTLIKAFSELASKNHNLKLLLVGDGYLKEDLESYISSHPGLENQVTLLGARTDVFEIMAISDIFSLAVEYPKGSESISISLAGMEAMAFSLPLITSDYEDQYYGIKDKENVLLVKPGDVEDVRKALTFLTENKNERSGIGGNASKYVENYFSVNEIVKIYESLYTKLI